MTKTRKIFLASSHELAAERHDFEVYIGRENKKLAHRGVFLELVIWEDFLDAMSRTRLQDESNRAIRECEIFVMLVGNKVGRYTAEEFGVAFGHFQQTNRPLVFTYFRTPAENPPAVSPEDERSVREFREKLAELGHFPTPYSNTDALLRHFDDQLDKLAAAGFAGLHLEPPASTAGASRKVKVGKRGVSIGGNSSAPVNTGDTHIYDQRDQRTIVHLGAPAGASAAELRSAYLQWVKRRANELPLLAADSGKPVQLASVYTALLTRHARDETPDGRGKANAWRAGPVADDPHAAPRQSALEALDDERLLVLMGGPGSGKTTFLNFVALCMAGELLGEQPTDLRLLRQPLPVDDGDDEAGTAPANKKTKAPKPQRWRHGALLPVRVLLRDFAASLPPPGVPVADGALWTFIVGQLPQPLARYADELQRELLAEGGLILLDGLDEVPDALQRREQVKRAVQDFAALHARCRFLVTSRTYAYQRQDWKLDGFAERELLPFTRGQIERFIDTWYAHLAHDLCRLTESDANGRAALLKRATQRRELRELAERPLLLTLMARLQSKSGGSLPENREELYAQSVDMLLDEWEGLKLRRDANGKPVVSEPSLSEWLSAPRNRIREQLDKLAYHAHRQQPQLTGTADLRQSALIEALYAASSDPDVRLKRIEEYLRDRAGLLTSHGEGLYQFPHRSFQEYLAACHLARFDYPDTLSRLARSDPNRWREVTLLAAARSKASPSAIWELVDALCAEDDALDATDGEQAGEAHWGALLAAQVLHETGLAAVNPDLQARHERRRQRVRDRQLVVLAGTRLPARERALAGDLLAQLGDPRRHLREVDAMRFVFVPRGRFWMGEAGNKDAPLHENDTLDDDYWIGESPVTVAQFRQFVEASGYARHQQQALQKPENRPVASVRWHDALAFCRWLDARWRARLPAGWAVTLPSEAEWEKAARGGIEIPGNALCATLADGFVPPQHALQANPQPQRIYPWGDTWDPERGNADEDIGQTTTAGCFSRGGSPAGCEDMAGNVWEWTRSLWGEDWRTPDFRYPYDAHDATREDLSAKDDILRVVRGGSWLIPRDNARCAVRNRRHPNNWNDNGGFLVMLRCVQNRVVLTTSSHSLDHDCETTCRVATASSNLAAAPTGEPSFPAILAIRSSVLESKMTFQIPQAT